MKTLNIPLLLLLIIILFTNCVTPKAGNIPGLETQPSEFYSVGAISDGQILKEWIYPD